MALTPTLPSYQTVPSSTTYMPGNTESKGMDPVTMSFIASAVMGYLGSQQQANAANNQAQQNAQQTEEGRGDSMAAQVANFLNGQMNLKNQQGMQGLASTQMDPYSQAKALNSANVKRSFGQGYDPTKGFSGGFDLSALDPSNLAASKTQFDQYAAAASPNVPINGDPTAEDFRTKYAASQQTLQDQIMSYLRNIGMYDGRTKQSLYPANFQNDPSAPKNGPLNFSTGANPGGAGRGGY